MVSAFKLLTVLQIVLTAAATLTREGPPFKRSNNNTWIISYTNFNHPGPALKRQPDNVGGIRFSLRRTIWETHTNNWTLTFVPVAENQAVYCSYGVLEPLIKSEWRQCNGHQLGSVPPGDEGMTNELFNRLRFRLSELKTSPSGNFESVTMNIVNHVVPKKYMHGDVPNAPGAWDKVPMVRVYSTNVVYEVAAAKCSLRDLDYTVGQGWEECNFGERASLVQEETITDSAFELKYWKLNENPLPQAECSY